MEKLVPSVLAMTLDEAKQLLYNKNVNVEIQITQPVGRGQVDGHLRVICQKRITDSLHELVVSHESYKTSD